MGRIGCSSSSSFGLTISDFPYGSNQVPQWPGVAGLKVASVKEPGKTVLVEEYIALSPYSWHEPAAAPGHYNDARCVLSFVDGHATYLKMYWDSANARGTHLEAWQYDPHLNMVIDGAQTNEGLSEQRVALIRARICRSDPIKVPIHRRLYNTIGELGGWSS